MTEITIGLDISKDTLDACRLGNGEVRSFANDVSGRRALIAWIGKAPSRIVYEPTGPYHSAVERVLGGAGHHLVKVNPRQARRFAEATGKLAKTDRLDAAMLARMGQVLALPARAMRSDLLHDLKALLVARDALVKDRTAAKNRAKHIRLKLLKLQCERRLRQIEKDIRAIEVRMHALIGQDAALVQRLDILVSIPGIAKVSAFALIIDMPELGTLDAKQAAGLAGLAPITRQSGAWRGKAFIRGGRAGLRQALYMPALVAIRFNPDLKAKYDQLIASGKPAKKAITAIMRKLIVLANALLRDGRKWSQNLA